MSDRRYDATLIDAKSAINSVGTIGIVDSAHVTEYGFHVETSAGVSAGAVKIETASDPNYAGTWAVLSTVTLSAASTSQYVGITDAVRCIRARISTTVTGGTVTVMVAGNRQ
jgi:hypothetical protein